MEYWAAMPIRFTIDDDRGYFVSKFEGLVSNEELLSLYQAFYRDEWRPGMNELVDLSTADVSQITSLSLRDLATYIRRLFEEHGVDSCRTAVCAAEDSPYGLARIYKAFSLESPESVRVFREMAEARKWVEEQQGEQKDS